MGIKAYAGTVLTVFALLFIFILLSGQLLGQPIGLGFVVTGSMSPTLEPGDGFVAIPPALAGDIEQGDVITWEAQEIQGGGLTTHRIVGETPQGYVTRGDANPFTDQDGGEPHVRESEIKAVALQWDGSVVVIPNLGTAVMAMQGAFETVAGAFSGIPGVGALLQGGGIGTVMIGIGVIVLVLSTVADAITGSARESASRSRSRQGVLNPFVVLIIIILLITVPATASMIIPSGTNEVQYISSTAPSGDPTIIQRGGSQVITYNGTNQGFVPSIVILEPSTEGVTVSNPILELNRGSNSESNVTITVPNETGAYTRGVSEHYYTKLLPSPIIKSLHDIHPWVAILVLDLVMAVFVTVIFVITIGFNPMRIRSTERNISTLDKLKRKLP